MSNDGITIPSSGGQTSAGSKPRAEPGPRTKMHAADAKSAAGKGEKLAGRLSELGFASTPCTVPPLSMPTIARPRVASRRGAELEPAVLPEGTFRSERAPSWQNDSQNFTRRASHLNEKHVNCPDESSFFLERPDAAANANGGGPRPRERDSESCVNTTQVLYCY